MLQRPKAAWCSLKSDEIRAIQSNLSFLPDTSSTNLDARQEVGSF